MWAGMDIKNSYTDWQIVGAARKTIVKQALPCSMPTSYFTKRTENYLQNVILSHVDVFCLWLECMNHVSFYTGIHEKLNVNLP